MPTFHYIYATDSDGVGKYTRHDSEESANAAFDVLADHLPEPDVCYLTLSVGPDASATEIADAVASLTNGEWRTAILVRSTTSNV